MKQTAYQILHDFLRSLKPADQSFARAQLILKLSVAPESILASDDDPVLRDAVQEAVTQVRNGMAASVRSSGKFRNDVTVTQRPLKKPGT
jgi:hypothetical protein